jgi:tRNA-dihydrouridine synthase B
VPDLPPAAGELPEERGAGPAGATADLDRLSRPLDIGPLRLDRRLIMAPMAGITTAPFRASVRRWGAGLVFTEMISACGVHYRNRRTLDYLACRDGEHPIGYQLFGAEPEVLADAAAVAVEAGADLVDLNMACPVRKVVKTGAGAALLAEPERAAAIVAAVVRAVGPGVPVTVKLRAGLRDGDEAWRQVAPRLVEAGAAALCIHPRTAGQLYRGHADHEVTRALAAAVPVPVVASGDVDGRAAALALLDLGAAGVMLARGALGSPWLFREVLDGAPPPPQAARLAELRAFTADVVADMGPRAVGHLRQFWPRFRRSGTIDRPLSLELMRAATVEQLGSLLGL